METRSSQITILFLLQKLLSQRPSSWLCCLFPAPTPLPPSRHSPSSSAPRTPLAARPPPAACASVTPLTCLSIGYRPFPSPASAPPERRRDRRVPGPVGSSLRAHGGERQHPGLGLLRPRLPPKRGIPTSSEQPREDERPECTGAESGWLCPHVLQPDPSPAALRRPAGTHVGGPSDSADPRPPSPRRKVRRRRRRKTVKGQGRNVCASVYKVILTRAQPF